MQKNLKPRLDYTDRIKKLKSTENKTKACIRFSRIETSTTNTEQSALKQPTSSWLW